MHGLYFNHANRFTTHKYKKNKIIFSGTTNKLYNIINNYLLIYIVLFKEYLYNKMNIITTIL